MKSVLSILACAAALLFATHCSRSSGIGMRLPDGDPTAGRVAFVYLGCTNCHRVYADPDLPAPTASPPVHVLGVGAKRSPRDGYLVTAILNPSHRITKPYPGQKSVDSSGKSRMSDFTERMTVRQMIDVISYLHTRYNLGTDPELSGKAPVGALPTEAPTR